MNYTDDDITTFQLSDDPADALLRSWGTKRENNVSRLIEHLLDIDREDLVDMLEE